MSGKTDAIGYIARMCYQISMYIKINFFLFFSLCPPEKCYCKQ